MSHVSRSRVAVLSIALAGMMAMGMLTSVLSTAPAHDDRDMEISYRFQQPTVAQLAIAGVTYDEVSIPEGVSASRPGMPRLPARGAIILLPPDATADTVTVTASGTATLGRGYRLPPMDRATPLMEPADAPSPGPVYESNEPFPGRLHDVVGIHSCRGYRVLVLRLYPVQYVPSTGELRYHPHLEVTVGLTGYEPPEHHRGTMMDRQVIMQRVDNPSAVNGYPAATGSNNGLLIVTTMGLQQAFTPLREYHESHGTPADIVTLDTTGETSEMIRSYIRRAYQEQNIGYVLLGGDSDIVPDRQLWVEGMDENITHYETYLPADHYYGCLDGPYNGDGDQRWGEPTDGSDGGDVDLMAEVYVGRAPVGSAGEARTFVDKTISYLDMEPSRSHRAITMAGEYMGDHGIASWGANYVEQHVGTCTADGYTTHGIPSQDFTLTRLYDRDWPDDHWSAGDLIGQINRGTHAVDHVGHSSYTYSMRMTPDDLGRLDNTMPCFIYSQGCMAGGYDHPREDCMAEQFTVKTKHGAFAAIMNARYGWFWSGRTDGDSQRYQRQFWDAVFGENITTLGRANQDSKEDNLFLIDRSCMRWTYYGLNLFGDPSIVLRINNAPSTPTAPAGEQDGETRDSYRYTTKSVDVEDDGIYYQWDWDDGTVSEWHGPYPSNVTVNASHSWTSRGTYRVRVRARDGHGMTSDWSEPLQVHMPYTPRFPLLDALLGWLRLLFAMP